MKKKDRDIDYKKDIGPASNEMTENMEDVRTLGREMEQISQK